MTMDRSALNRIRGSIGMGQGNVRNQDTRSNDMAYAPQSGGFGWMGQGQNAGTQASPYGQKPMPNGAPEFGGSGMNAQPNGGGMQQGAQGFGPQRQPGMPSDYAQQYNRFASAGGAPGAFQGRMGAQGPQYRPGTNLQGGMGVNPKPLGPGGGVTDPPEYGLPPADGYGGNYGADRSLESYMSRPSYVRPRFGVGP